ncbi:MAG TPA: hypothetical protein VJP02_30840 [Candidatus Sulfotelmatobacter sp.]|nr:hypothetical protein [Candidatus Sulfotelmatobacter sp.]
MKRNIDGLRAADTSNPNGVPDGIYLARLVRMRFRKYAPKAYYSVALSILEPKHFAGNTISSRVFCYAKALWKLSWFLRDFGYDTELLGRDEVDEKRAVGLTGVVKISNVVYDGMALLRFDGFAPASRWEELSPANLDRQAS